MYLAAAGRDVKLCIDTPELASWVFSADANCCACVTRPPQEFLCKLQHIIPRHVQTLTILECAAYVWRTTCSVPLCYATCASAFILQEESIADMRGDIEAFLQDNPEILTKAEMTIVDVLHVLSLVSAKQCQAAAALVSPQAAKAFQLAN